ncbi:MAG: GNAT family N-acetyltransferase [Lachnospiraceae bacterium]|nr:GNAT family N-acetyltransferase [Lachnospiraceae bacterium]
MEIIQLGKKTLPLFQEILFEPERALLPSSLAIGMVEDGVPAGTAVFGLHQGQLRLYSIYVRPEYRRRGIASKVIRDLAALGQSADALFLEADFMDTQEDVGEFLHAMGFLLTPDSAVYEFDLRRARESEAVRKWLYRKEYPGNLKSFAALEEKEKRRVLRFLEDTGYPLERLEERSFDPELGQCIFFPGIEVQSVLVCLMEGGDIIIDHFASKGKMSLESVHLFRGFLDALDKRGVEDAKVLFLPEQEKIVEFAETILQEEIRQTGVLVHSVLELC